MQKLRNSSYIKKSISTCIFFLLLFLPINADEFSFEKDSLSIINTSEQIKNNSSCLINGIGLGALTLPVSIFNGFGVAEIIDEDMEFTPFLLTFTGCVLLQTWIGYLIGENALQEKFILKGFLGANYSISSNSKWFNNLGGNVSLYCGYKFNDFFSTGFEFNTIYKGYKKEDDKKRSLDLTIPFMVSLKKDINANNSVSLYLGIGKVFSFDDAPFIVSTNQDYISYSTLIKSSAEYSYKKNIIRFSHFYDNTTYDSQKVHSFLIEYGRAFYN